MAGVWDVAQGRGVTVAVVDSGVDYSPQLAGRVSAIDLTGQGPRDCVGHGTAVASLIAASDAQPRGIPFYGVAPAARILSVKVNTGETGFSRLLAQGIRGRHDRRRPGHQRVGADRRELAWAEPACGRGSAAPGMGQVADLVGDDVGYPARWQALPGVVLPQASEIPPVLAAVGHLPAQTSLVHSVNHVQLYLGLMPQSRRRKRSGGTLPDPDSGMQDLACRSQAAHVARWAPA